MLGDLYQHINGKPKVLNNQFNLGFTRIVIIESKCFQINWASHAIHTFNFQCPMKKSKELESKRRSKEAILNNLKTPTPQPLKIPISLPLPFGNLRTIVLL